MNSRQALFITAVALLISSCSKVGYVPLTEVPVSIESQVEQSETRKFMSRNNRPSNSRLPDSKKFMRKGNRPSNSRLPEGDKLQNVKLKMSKSQKRQAKHFKKKKKQG